MTNVRSAYDIWDGEPSLVRDEFALYFDDEPSLADQSFKDECDINNIMAKYVKTGLMEHVNRYQGQYGDITAVVDYHTALNTVIEAEEAFMSLPAQIRSKFDNDPGAFLEFVDDPANQEEMIKMGLSRPHEAPAPIQPPVVEEKSEGG